MALTEEEKRLLAQLEASLTAEDPQLANRLRGAGQRRLPVRRMALAVTGVAAGLTLLVIGMQTHLVVSVLGFLVMLAAAVIGMGAWRDDDPDRPGHTAKSRGRRPLVPHDGEFIDRIEERWRRRHDGQ